MHLNMILNLKTFFNLLYKLIITIEFKFNRKTFAKKKCLYTLCAYTL